MMSPSRLTTDKPELKSNSPDLRLVNINVKNPHNVIRRLQNINIKNVLFFTE